MGYIERGEGHYFACLSDVSSPKGEFAEKQIQSYQTSLAYTQSVRKYPLGAKFSKAMGFVALGKKS
jgi:hypothetical protein